MQVDTKYILDKNPLPKEVHVKACELPIYHWSLIDVATRANFIALSYELSSFFEAVFFEHGVIVFSVE